MRAELIGPDDDRWSRMLGEVRHDFYHLPAYATLSALEEGGSALALYVEARDRRLLLPLIARTVAGGRFDVSSPYGYPGPLLCPAGDDGFLREAMISGCETLATESFVSLFVRMHPLLCPHPPKGLGHAVQHPPTVVIDLSLSDRAWHSQMRKSHRQQITRAVADGHRASIDGDWAHFETFKSIYRATMQRVEAQEFYHFSDAYFDRLREALGDRLHLCVIQYQGRVWSAGLFVETCGIVESHLSGDDGRHRRGGAKKLMYAFMREWARTRGDRWLHLGGGSGPSENLLSFKSGFSSDSRPFDTLRVVLDREEYARLVREHDAALDADDLGGFFPLYRSPAPSR